MALVDTSPNRDPLEPKLPQSRGAPGYSEEAVFDEDLGYSVDVQEDERIYDEVEILALAQDHKRVGRNLQQYHLDRWEYAEMAWRSEHYSGSKYHKAQYKNRAKYFKPKSRVATEKAITAARVALFASADVLSFSAEDDSDPKQRANAALLREIINARFNNKTRKSGVNWQQVVLGARKDAYVMGICASKQDWQYKTRKRIEHVEVEEPEMTGAGEPVIDIMTGQPRMARYLDQREVIDVVIDKPTITLIPPEHVIISPTADWMDPAQTSQCLMVEWPMTVNALKKMMANEKSTVVWRKDIIDADFDAALYTENELMGLKAAREGNSAAQTRTKSKGPGKYGHLGSEVIAVVEFFWEEDGEDMHCWMLRDRRVLSVPMPTHEVYPAHGGARPYVLGTDTIEPHVVYPESHISAGRSSQSEINDFANITMDGARKSVFPIATVKRGHQIDYKSVQRGDAEGVVQVQDQDDIKWDRPPINNGQAHQERNLLNSDADEIFGQFSQGSVESNKALNETVGGMQIIAANAGSTSETHLAIFAETYVERVVSQIVSLVQYYEDDANLLAVSGRKAKLMEKFGVDKVTDELLETQIKIALNIQIGGSDPMMRLMKAKTAHDMAAPVLASARQDGKVKEVKYDEILDEIYSLAGYRDGANRFVTFADPNEPAPMGPEAVAQLQQQMQELQQQTQELGAENQQLKTKAEVETQKIAASAQTEDKKLGVTVQTKDAELSREDRRIALEERKQTFAEQQAERELVQQAEAAKGQEKEAFLKAGLPPDYSYEVDQEQRRQSVVAMMTTIMTAEQEQTATLMDALERGRVEAADAVARVEQNTTQIMGRLAGLIEQNYNDLLSRLDEMEASRLAPKTITYDDEGHPTGTVSSNGATQKIVKDGSGKATRIETGGR